MLIVGTNSYVSQAEADAFVATYAPEGTAPLTELELIQATRAIDVLYGTRFADARTDEAQALEFPRGAAPGSTPRAIKEATIEIALLARTADVYAQPEPRVIEKEDQVGDLKERVKFDSSGSSTRHLHRINVLLEGLLATPLRRAGWFHVPVETFA